jgi:hypothetical protein
VSADFDIFGDQPVQDAVQETLVVTYKPIANIDNLQINILADDVTAIDPNIHIYVSGKITAVDGKDLDQPSTIAYIRCFLSAP